jgi:hypothetical protein
VESAYKFQYTLIINSIDCSRRCSGQYQVAKADEKRSEESGEEGNKVGGKESNKEGGKEGGERRNSEGDDENEEDGNEEIFSPASYVNRDYFGKRLNDNEWRSQTRGSNARQRADRGDPRLRDDTQFFRRIFVIRMNNIPDPLVRELYMGSAFIADHVAPFGCPQSVSDPVT